ncbi:glycosyl transferase family 90 [Mangrovibacterium diazotrophicum]|uniref:Glycosyl transferase family 90 n=1 Tax=Mangrovibacterium diazotrophicum TaxID=1261403 RepID=A0A419W753_9BACT|nr:glycosyl transferase family 90 [Mangrovibacterium diazotrophicum]RKD91182.1 glycosyl transferase family 90 [Mangrovibacterium diazotrophicum]
MVDRIDSSKRSKKLTKLRYSLWGLTQKNLKQVYYIVVFSRFLVPRFWSQFILRFKLKRIQAFDADYVYERVNYYNKLTECSTIKDKLESLKDYKLPERQRVYYFDSYQYIRYFSFKKRANFLFGDVTTVPDLPAFVKSRPIHGDNRNSVVLKLVKARHFLFVNDPVPFAEKKDMLIGRSAVSQPHRQKFLEMYFDHPMCNVGQINLNEDSHRWQLPKITLREHLNYKFILCLEGNDVATNLKWVMSSNSLAVMPKPIYETWFMEGKLIPDYHYVEIKSDYSDLQERLSYYIEHEDEALQIIQNANNYVKQFKNKKRESLISLMVIKKYFDMTGQGPFAGAN